MAEIILITGANRGIGLALTKEFLGRGQHVLAACRRPGEAEDLQHLKERYSNALDVVGMDITSEAAVLEAAAKIQSETDRLDVLINNAGIFPEEGNESILDIDLGHFREAFETNVIGTARVTRAFVPLLERAQRPRVVNISSGAGSISDKTDHAYYAYSTSKAALNMLTRAMASELKSRNICIVAMTPGWVRTEMGGENAPLAPEDSAKAIAQTALKLSLADTAKFIERDGQESRYAW